MSEDVGAFEFANLSSSVGTSGADLTIADMQAAHGRFVVHAGRPWEPDPHLLARYEEAAAHFRAVIAARKARRHARRIRMARKKRRGW